MDLTSDITLENVTIRNQPQSAVFAVGVSGLKLCNVSLSEIDAIPDSTNNLNNENYATKIPDFIAPGSVPIYLLATSEEPC